MKSNARMAGGGARGECVSARVYQEIPAGAIECGTPPPFRSAALAATIGHKIVEPKIVRECPSGVEKSAESRR
ncbi:MAG: hypothetical protein EAZ36_06470 [Verrucomicrobia bacterium]|nr:MAG: hypothetical protein EAZ36_06470 [Verrucomicrobiota bacterium]